MSRLFAGIVLAACFVSSDASAKDTMFWNLTAQTITSLQLSPAGDNVWGPDQTANDSDHSVDHDERLKVTGIATGLYDVKFADKSGRSCVVRGVAIKQGAIFSIDEKKAQTCGK